MNAATLFLLFLCPVCFAFNSISLRLFQTEIAQDTRSLLLFQAAFCFLASLLVAAGIRSAPSLLTVMLAVVFGAGFFLCILCSARCLLIGPMSLTSVLINSSMLLPIFWSVLFWQESLSGRTLIGILLIFATFTLSSLSREPQKSKKRDHKKWLCLVLVAFLCNGITAIVQKARQQAEPQGDPWVFLAISYLTAALLFFLSYFLQRKNSPSFSANVHRPLWWTLAALAGVGTFSGSSLLQILYIIIMNTYRIFAVFL